jgi:hypothetical protein
MVNIRTVASSCLGVTGNISINRDLYGYRSRDANGRLFGALDANDTLPATNTPTGRSLKAHLRQISGHSINVTIFMVGLDPVDPSKSTIDIDDYTRVQYSIQVCRDIYAQAGIGVRKLYWRYISPDDAGGYVDIDTGAEATDLTDDFSGPEGDSIDLFFVRNITGAAGWSNEQGPCDKDAKDERTGSVCELTRPATFMGPNRFTGVLVAHEMGHYLGLGSGPGITNVMGSDVDGDGIDTIGNNSTNITASQASTMRSHCSVQAAC